MIRRNGRTGVRVGSVAKVHLAAAAADAGEARTERRAVPAAAGGASLVGDAGPPVAATRRSRRPHVSGSAAPLLWPASRRGARSLWRRGGVSRGSLAGSSPARPSRLRRHLLQHLRRRPRHRQARRPRRLARQRRSRLRHQRRKSQRASRHRRSPRSPGFWSMTATLWSALCRCRLLRLPRKREKTRRRRRSCRDRCRGLQCA